MIRYNLSGTWRTVKNVYARVSGTWRTVGQVSVRTGGAWRNVWSYAWNTGSWGTCSASCGGGTQTRSVTCLRNDGQTVADSLCTKYAGSKPAASQQCNTQSCAECRYSNTSPRYQVYWFNLASQRTIFQWNGEYVYENESALVSSCTVNGYLYTKGAIKEDVAPTQRYEICRAAV